MSKSWLAFVVFALFATVLPVSAQTEEPPTVYSPAFIDVPADHVLGGDIRTVAAAGLTRGCDEAGVFFCPDRAVTRGEMAAFLVRALGWAPAGETSFDDTTDSVFAADIATLAAAGVTRGCNPPENTQYCPDRAVTRAEMAAFLVRAFGWEQAPEGGFIDTVGSVFATDIATLAAAGVTRGCNPPVNDSYCPDRTITRAEMAAFLARALGLTSVPEVPDGVRFSRTAPSSGVGSTLDLCQETGPVTVRNAARGGISFDPVAGPNVIDPAGGVYDPERDVWTTGVEAGCFLFEARWDPRAVEVQAPLSSLRITSHFGYRWHPILGIRRLHAGTDFAAATGTAVMSVAEGTVVQAGWDAGYGRAVVVAHAGGLSTRYAHLSSFAVAKGDVVPAGTMVGRSGCSGLCTGPHLHFEVMEFGVPVDPLTYLP